MQEHIVQVKTVEKITHDVLRIIITQPENYCFTPGQATNVSINKAGWRDEKRPFMFTCLPNMGYLEFTIKTYPAHKGVTNELLQLKKDDELILNDVFGAITYKGEGIFIAGGAGITPFISIFRYLHSKNEIGNNKLIFANKTSADIINREEFKKLLGTNFINILSDEKVQGYANGQISKEFINTYYHGANTKFYLCGPPLMMDAVMIQLVNLNINKKSIIKESF